MFDQDRLFRLTASLLPAAVVAVSLLQDAQAYEMVAYEDAAGSSALFEGRYADAAAAAVSSRPKSSEAALQAQTNLCAALALSGDLVAAERACLHALDAAKRVDRTRGRMSRGVETGKALNNLGVLRALTGDRARAAENFRRADRFGGWPGASRNLVYLQNLDAPSRVARLTD